MVYSQIWLNLLTDHSHYFYIGTNLWKMVASFGKDKNSNKSHCQVHNFLELQCLALRERMQSVCSLYSCKYETLQVQVVHVKDDTSRTPPTSNKCCPTSHHTWDSMAEGGRWRRRRRRRRRVHKHTT